MAELHVQRKRNSLFWLWVLLLLAGIAAGIYLYLHYKDPKGYPLPGKATSSLNQATGSALKTIRV